MSKHYDLIILGSGPAGCTAAIYAARANLKPAMITGPEVGGQLTRTTKIANWPGEEETISGAFLMEKMMHQVRNFGTTIEEDTIKNVDLSRSPFYLRGEHIEYTCQTLIIATGSSPALLGIPSEQQYFGRGVSTCSTCDGFFYKNKNVVVIGGGDTAAAEALYLAQFATQVTIIHRRGTLRTKHWLTKQLKEKTNIKLLPNWVVQEILGNEQGVTGIRIKNNDSQTIETLDAHGVFLAIGVKPNIELFEKQLAIKDNHIQIFHNAPTATSVPGVFAAGDVAAPNYHQAIIAAGLGCVAALDAQKFLNK